MKSFSKSILCLAVWFSLLTTVPALAQQLPAVAPASVGMSATQLAHIDEAVASEIAKKQLPGAVVVVGLSLPPPSPLLYAEYACLKRSGEPDSYLMLSRLPALRKAFQAAGRHVRSPGKKGLVFLLDERFSPNAVIDLMPSWLRKDLLIGDFTPQSLTKLATEFWDSADPLPHPS